MGELNHWIEVSETRLQQNFATLQRAVGADVSLLAVIKADAYGHGAAVVAPVLAKAGAQWLGVTDAAEGVAVRKALCEASQQVGGPTNQPEILVMTGLCAGEAKLVVEHNLTPVVWSAEQFGWLSAAAEAAGRPVRVHVEIDTGMSRQGAKVGVELDAALVTLATSKWLRPGGIFTHFASAEVAGSLQTVHQRGQFEKALSQRSWSTLAAHPEWVHAGNSSMIDEGVLVGWLRGLASGLHARAMVRPGVALYGYCLPLEGGTSQVRRALQPVMSWKARVIGLREIEAGERVGYNGTFIAPQQMRIALLPVGYADGLRRELSSRNDHTGGWVMLHGQRAPIVGRVSMNLTVVDVTEIPEVALGDVATVLGDGVTAEDHARLAETLPYEILCGVRAEPVLV